MDTAANQKTAHTPLIFFTCNLDLTVILNRATLSQAQFQTRHRAGRARPGVTGRDLPSGYPEAMGTRDRGSRARTASP
jgi:hypothetical protein